MKNFTKIISISLLVTSAAVLAKSPTHQKHGEATMVEVEEGCQGQSEHKFTVPIVRAKTGHILVNGIFNGVESQTIVDTGGIGVGGVVSQEVLDKMNQNQADSLRVDVQGANHSQAMQMLKVDSAGIPQAKVANMNFVVSPKAIIPDHNIQTLLGSRYLCNFVVEFDLVENLMTLYPKKSSLKSLIGEDRKSWSVTSFDDVYNSGAMIIDMETESKPVKAVIDTGARHSVMNWKAAKALGLTKNSSRVSEESNSGRGIHGNAPQKTHAVNLSSLSLAKDKLEQKNIKMRISDMGSFKSLVGNKAAVNLGMDFFEGRKILIDYSSKRIAFTHH